VHAEGAAKGRRGEPTARGLAAAAGAAFGLAPPRPVHPVPLPGAAAALDPASHPRLTLVTQSAAGARVAWAGLTARPPPALWIDTAGWAGGYPLAALAGCRVAAYVHYPLVSTDMLGRVGGGGGGGGGRGLARSAAKAAYYYAVAALYGAAAGLASGAVMANSTWTAAHVRALWWRAAAPALVHPPCGAAGLASLPLARPAPTGAVPLLVCVAQFRPEKAQGLLLRAFAAARADAAAVLLGGGGASPPAGSRGRAGGRSPAGAAAAAAARAAARATLSARLLFFGSVRPGGPDEARVAGLRALAAELGLLEEGGAGGGGGGGGAAAGAPAAPPATRRRGRGPAAAGALPAASADPDPDPDAAAAANPAATPASLLAAWTRAAAPPVGFVVGAPRPVLAVALGAASAGLHAMTDEHFGISVVEYMAAGAVPIAHASGGPASDIVLPEAAQPPGVPPPPLRQLPPPGGGRARRSSPAAPPPPPPPALLLPTGYLCTTQAEYAAAMGAVLGMQPGERDAMAGRARARAARFSDAAFAAAFVDALAPAAVAAGLGAPRAGAGVARSGSGVRRSRGVQ